MALLSNKLFGVASAAKKNTAKKNTSTASGKGTGKPASSAPVNIKKKPSSNTSKKNTIPSKGTASPTAGVSSEISDITDRKNTISAGRTSTPAGAGGSSGSGSSGSYGGSSGGSGGSTAAETVPNYQQQLMDYFREQNEKARQSAIDAITQRVATQEGLYNTQIDDLSDQYQALRNQSEVERYKTRSALRESLANRGQLDSGYGRQENLIMDTQYGNAINSINMQEQKAKDDIRNLISQLKAEAEAEKNQINNQYNQAIAQAMTSLGLNE